MDTPNAPTFREFRPPHYPAAWPRAATDIFRITAFIQTDFLTAILPQVDVVVARGSLNYKTENVLHPFQAIERMWEIARRGEGLQRLDPMGHGGCRYQRLLQADLQERGGLVAKPLVQGLR